MTYPTTIDTSAPVVATDTVDVAAPPEVVWRLLTDVDAWPRWHPDVTSARLAGELVVGATFAWSSLGFASTSTVYAVTRPSRVLWGEQSDGITGVHEWRLAATPAGTHVETARSFAGPPIDADVAGMRLVLDASLRSWVVALRRAAESGG